MSDRPITAKPWVRRDSRPPFEVDNVASLTHGACSARRWRPLADEMAVAIVEDAPWLARPAFAGAVAAWSVAEAQSALVDEWLDGNGLLDDSGTPRPATALVDKLHRRAARARAALGLDPASFARLLLTFSQVPGDAGEGALQLLRAEGGAILAARPSNALAPMIRPWPEAGLVGDRETVLMARSGV